MSVVSDAMRVLQRNRADEGQAGRVGVGKSQELAARPATIPATPVVATERHRRIQKGQEEKGREPTSSEPRSYIWKHGDGGNQGEAQPMVFKNQ